MIGRGYELGDNLMINDLDIVQWDYLLSPEFEMINSAGKPLTGGYIEVYIHGTRDKYYCASDFNGTLHPFQIPLDSIGSNVILASPENAYDVYVYNKFGSLIMSRYNVHCQGGNGGSSTYVGDKLFYGQYRASNVVTIANLRRNKGNINLTSNGYLKLKNGMSYHITVRGAFQIDDVTNTETTLNYIEYTSVNPIKIDIDETKEGPQYFELSYDIYRLPDDMDYQVAFAQSNGMVTELLVEVHSLSNLATSSAGGDQEYEEGWGIDITNNVISVDPSILDDYVTEEELLEIVTGITGVIPEDVATHTEVYEATVTAIELVTGMIPSSQVQSNWDETDESSPAYIQNKPDLDVYATHDEVYESSVSSIQLVTGLIPDVSDYATHTEVYEATVTAIELVTGVMPETIDLAAGQNIGIFEDGNTLIIAASGTDLTDYTTHEEVSEAIVTAIEYVTGIIPDAQVQSDWEQSDDTQPDYIKNKPDLDIYATHDEVNTVSGQIIEIVNNVSGDIIATVNNVSGDIIETVNNVSGNIISTVNNVSGVLHGEIENIPEQVQSDWDQSDDTQVDYIKNKPDLSIYATHDEVVSAVSSIDLSEYATHTEVYDSSVTAIQMVTGLIPDVSDFTTHDEVHESIVSALEYVTGIIPDAQVQSDWTETNTTDPAYIKHKPENIELVAGQNIGLFDNGDTFTIAASGTDLTDYATESDVNSAIVTAINYVTGVIPDVSDFTTHTEVSEAIVTALEYVTGIIPEAQVQSDWNETDTSDPSYIQNKPDLDIYVTHDELVEVVSAVTGIGDYGQFYSTAVSGAAIMSRTKGTIDVTNDGKIKLKKDSSYHVTVRGRYNQTTPNNVYSNISYIEYITFSNININVDKSITESQYFEISYDLYKLNSDTDYYIFFSGLEGTVNDLFIEIHAIGSVGAGVSGGAGTEYDAGWGIQILNNVISVDPSIFNNYVTENELVTAIQSVVTAIPAAQVQSDWNQTDNTQPDYIKNKPDLNQYATDTEVSEAIVTAIEAVTSIIPVAQVQSDWTEDDTSEPSYIQNKPLEYELIAGNNIAIDVQGTSVIISSTGLATESEVYNAIVTGVQAATGLIPDVSDMATQTWVNNQGFLTSVPDTYATDSEVSEAIASSITDFVTESQVTAMLPDSEEVQFEELDISQFAQASAIPDVSDFTTHTEVYESIVTGVQAATGWADSQGYLTSVPDTYATDTEVSQAIASSITDFVTEAQVTALIPDTSDMATKTWVGNQGYLTSVPDTYATDIEVSEAIATATNDMATQTWVGNQGYLTEVPSTYATDSEVSQAIASAVTGFVTEAQVTALIPDSEEVDFEELDITQFAQASAVPTVQLNGSDQVTAINNHEIAGTGGATYTAGDGIDITNDVISLDQPYDIIAGNNITITVTGVSAIISAQGGGGGGAYTAGQYISIDSNDVIAVTGLEPLPDSEEVDFEEINLANYALVSAVPTVQLNGSDQVTAINNHPIAGGGGGGTTYTAGNGIDITSNVISIDNTVALKTDIPVVTGYIPYSASGVELPNSHFKIEPNGQAYKYGSQTVETVIPNESYYPQYFYASFQTVPTDKTITFTFDSYSESGTPAKLYYYVYDSNWNSKGNTYVNITNNTASFSIDSSIVLPTDAGIGVDIMTSDNSYLDWTKLVNGKLAYTDTVSFNIPYVTQDELSGNMLSVSNDTLNVTTTAGITDIQLVSALPVDTVSSVLYLIPEA